MWYVVDKVRDGETKMEGEMLEFKMGIRAKGQERVRARAIKSASGKVFSMVYKSGEQREYEEWLDSEVSVNRPKNIIEGGVRVELVCMIKVDLKSASEARKRLKMCHVMKPDVDNIGKNILDSMTRCGYWRDDAQVWSLKVSKCWGEVDCIGVKIVPIDEEDIFSDDEDGK